MKVCLVEDDPIMKDHIEAVLQELGCEVTAVADVTSGLAVIHRDRPDAVVVDILMPDRDGLNLIMDMRPLLDEVRVVAITGGGRVGATAVLQMARGLGAHAGLVKPFSATDLRDALQLA